MPAMRFYFDFVSPYSYLAWVQIHEVAARHGRTVEPTPILFGVILGQRGARGPAEDPARRPYVIKDFVRRAHDLGVTVSLPPAHPFNPLLALRVASLPMAPATRHDVIDGLFAAAWNQERDLADRATVLAVARAAGLPATALVDAETPENKERLKATTTEAIAAGVFGVPTLIVDGELFFGSDSIAHLDRYLRGEDPVTPEMVERWKNLPAGVQRKV